MKYLEKDRFSAEIKPAYNGFIVETSWQEKKEGSEFSEYQSEKAVFHTWNDVLVYLNETFN